MVPRLEHHLSGLELGVPRQAGAHQLVPLKQVGTGPIPEARDLPRALSLGQLDIRDGRLINRGEQAIVALRGDQIPLAGRSRVVTRPLVIPPGERSLGALAQSLTEPEPGIPDLRSPMLPDRCLVGIDDLTSQNGNHAGAVLVIGKQHGCAAIGPNAALNDHALRLQMALNPLKAVEGLGLRKPLKAIRRFFLRVRYAETTAWDSVGEYAVHRVQAPLLEGWLITAGRELLFLELEATTDAFRRAGATAERRLSTSA